MKKVSILAVFIFISLLVCGCAGMYGTVLPSNPIAFSSFQVTDSKNTYDKYDSIEYNGRIYVPFGTVKSTLKKSEIDQCLGYLDFGTGPNNIHICTLTADPNNDFLKSAEFGIKEAHFAVSLYFGRPQDYENCGVKQNFANIAGEAVRELNRLLSGSKGRKVRLPHTLVRLKYEDIIC